MLNSIVRRMVIALMALWPLQVVQADELTVDKRLREVMTTQLDLTACGDTAYTYQSDEETAEIYNNLSFQLLDKTKEVGWTSEDLAIATVLVMENRTDLVLREDDTLEEFRLRNYTGERCERQVAAAKHYLIDDFPAPR
ncbi:MAG: hypothetical protein HLX50_21630 [Alteromonadaceae bacterium]|nr:hypothetical protein [Alteromonadaceae bacterium]